eukprot:CAMPEP_0114114290 /NCGR_PEP_ID=MMETSP0043_2-20121206/3357_1 /TAXON_ID=464988 /ORGANISM="Hemiselmis andersenii, Strain CCMP644" /LENGTH=53 /DNA_ID=CAMNT_0001206477 /DNA_START=119 /DNA_END=276 /DNA_ORIENTATION=+
MATRSARPAEGCQRPSDRKWSEAFRPSMGLWPHGLGRGLLLALQVGVDALGGG